ncbi:hypothetical protein J7E38_00795 [Bacillus sp. ISL-35]|uniref:hypothetical protein n=1 Tax=Bacillus sp. ISL-35 TaxID=2819122 RepID=UPI001BE62A9A|nr:hypothetical protein [Bacillus sp. ISL-35]MBT2677514.1 hypothetical protein [Bacillus sp. ISL-35]MBT2702098.1 hypothetical protein [Chryseobacterium sp. ISL-80]
MNFVIATEANPFIAELPDFKEVLMQVAPPHLIYKNFYIYIEQKDADEAIGLLREADLLESTHLLVKTEGSPGEDFFDYGFHVDGATCLFADELSAFRFLDGNGLQMEMALIQLEEHLIFKAANGIYFAANHYTELIMGIVKAYGVKVEFLDLDKWCKKI